MTPDLPRLAHTVLLPAIAGTTLDHRLESFLHDGGASLLLGETRAEYVARSMSAGRRAAESADVLKEATARVRELASVPPLVAVDNELGGIQRFEHLVTAPPYPAEARPMPSDELAAACEASGREVRALGVNVVLAPILDLTSGETPWLAGRDLGADAEETGRVGAAFIRGLQAAGVAATAKHFPGHRGVTTDPAVDAEATIPGEMDQVVADLRPFEDAVASGVRCVMTGPGTARAVDPSRPALLSPAVIALLRERVGFDGLVISDDLDAASVLAGRTIQDAAVEAVAAGNDLLLVSAENDLRALAETLVAAIAAGRLEESRLAEAAERVEALGAELG